MNLAFSTNAFGLHSLETAIRDIADAGYEAVEILADLPHLFPVNGNNERLGPIKDLVKELGLKVAALNANTVAGYYGRTFWEPIFEPSLSNPDHDARAWRIRHTRRCIAAAAELGAQIVVITSGRMVPGCPPEKGLDLLQSSLDELLPAAQASGVRLALEYEPGLLIEKASEAKRLFERFDSPFLGMNLDVGHSWVAGEEPVEIISALNEKIFHVHLEDIRGRKHYHLIPGEGEIPLSEIFTSLKKVHFHGFLVVELYTYPDRPKEAAAMAMEYLKKFFS
jgi:sugar phosphate isomerase/epimerase